MNEYYHIPEEIKLWLQVRFPEAATNEAEQIFGGKPRTYAMTVEDITKLLSFRDKTLLIQVEMLEKFLNQTQPTQINLSIFGGKRGT